MTELTVHELPKGRHVTRLIRNLRPGYIIIPPEWRGSTEDGHTTTWAIVTGHPIHLQLSSLTTGRKRWETRVACRFPHESETWAMTFDGKGSETVDVLIPAEAVAS